MVFGGLAGDSTRLPRHRRALGFARPSSAPRHGPQSQSETHDLHGEDVPGRTSHVAWRYSRRLLSQGTARVPRGYLRVPPQTADAGRGNGRRWTHPRRRRSGRTWRASAPKAPSRRPRVGPSRGKAEPARHLKPMRWLRAGAARRAARPAAAQLCPPPSTPQKGRGADPAGRALPSPERGAGARLPAPLQLFTV